MGFWVVEICVNKYTMLIHELLPLTENLIPDKLAVNPSVTPDGAGGLHSEFQVGSRQVELRFTRSGGFQVPKGLQIIVKPQLITAGRFNSLYDIGFTVGTGPDDMTDAKNRGEPVREALRIMSTVAGLIDKTVRKNRMPLLYYYGRQGENRDRLYARLADELTNRFQDYGYYRLDPNISLVHADPASHMWIHYSALAGDDQHPALKQQSKQALQQFML
jgi:hypothetical protein